MIYIASKSQGESGRTYWHTAYNDENDDDDDDDDDDGDDWRNFTTIT